MEIRVEKPNVRKMFIPDKDHIICEVDLKQADAQVVAWEAQDPILMDLFSRDDVDVHTENAKVAFAVDSITKHMRQTSKSLVHATNYYGKPRGIAKKIGLTTSQVTVFQTRWFREHPWIREWHQRVERDLMLTRVTRNILGFRKIWFERLDNLLPEALAWIPQSTVALVINRGMQNIKQRVPDVVPLLQVHDSFLFQLHRDAFYANLPRVQDAMAVALPYPRPLVIPVTLKTSLISWGDMLSTTWDGQCKIDGKYRPVI
jgi:DNA polymerase I-like protein with 3'-5' exonuclease and polymerase domains